MNPSRTLLACSAFVSFALLAHTVLAAAAPAVQLVESVPVETRIGNPALPRAHDVWLEMIRGAHRSIDLEEFYFSNWPREPLQDVVDALGAAARRGVRVRFILDAGMHRTYPEPAGSLGRLPNIEVRLLDMKRIAGGVQHAKFFIVDDADLFLGSQNFDWRALKHIHEMGVRIRDARAATPFREVFALDWNLAGLPAANVARLRAVQDSLAACRCALGERAQAMTALPVRVASAPGDTVDVWPSVNPRGWMPDSTRWDEDAIVRLLDRARREIAVQVLVYAPEDRSGRDDALDAALRRAAERGVHVKLLVSDWEADGDAIGSLQRLAREPNIEVKLSAIPEWSGGYIPFARVEHCKYAVVDSLWTWVGTSNWEPNYFHSSRNVAVTLKSERIARDARRAFVASWEAPSAHALDPDAHYARKVHGMTPPSGKKVYGR
jgi:phosphatidylserine/phosphatidylglycerophosphate/cardiolipin synthase-like enzyme